MSEKFAIQERHEIARDLRGKATLLTVLTLLFSVFAFAQYSPQNQRGSSPFDYSMCLPAYHRFLITTMGAGNKGALRERCEEF